MEQARLYGKPQSLIGHLCKSVPELWVSFNGLLDDTGLQASWSHLGTDMKRQVHSRSEGVRNPKLQQG
jgi:hypothetical protein